MFALTSRVLDGEGKVASIAMSPFLVLEPGEDTAGAEAELRRVELQIQALLAELEAARVDVTHKHHHWWLP